MVQHRMIRRELLAAARVEEPETQLASISARIGGRIDKLHVDFTGQPVRRGQPMAEIYSPEILSSAEEYKLALENRKRLAGSVEPQAISGADELIAASRRRLDLWGLTSQQIDTIATSDKPQIDLTIYSPASGIVTERKVTQGQYVNAGDVLFTVTDLSKVWVKADIYEADLPQVHVGQAVEIASKILPRRQITRPGRVPRADGQRANTHDRCPNRSFESGHAPSSRHVCAGPLRDFGTTLTRSTPFRSCRHGHAAVGVRGQEEWCI